MFKFTQFHEAIKAAILGSSINLGIDAGPGSGKTTTTFEVITPALFESGAKTGAFFAFTNKNADDFKERIGDFPGVIAGTIHSVVKNHTIYKSWGPIKVNAPQKTRMVKGRYIKERDGKAKDCAKKEFPEVNGYAIANVCRLVSLAKNNAFGIGDNPNPNDRNAWEELKARHNIGADSLEDIERENDEDIIEMAQKVFSLTIKDKSEIDFDDMLYFALYYDIPLPKWDFIVMDEAQDIFPITLEFLDKMWQKGTRIVFVGDRKQAVNTFAGSMDSSIDRMAERLEAEILPLPVSYRCSRKAAELANGVFPNSVIPGENALDGELIHMAFEDFQSQVPSMDDSNVLLSRTHKNLLPFAFAFIKENKPFMYKGIRETAVKMGRSLYHASKKSDKDLYQTRISLREYQTELEDKYLGKKVPKWVIEQGEILESLIQLIAAVEIDGGDFKTVKSYLNRLGDADNNNSNGGPTLATIHASKGGQWPNVWIIGECQSTLATTEAELAAETCLEFVAYTRSSQNIIRVAV